MKTNRVKSMAFMSGAPIDIYNDWVDVFVTLEDDDSEYGLEVTTPQALASYMGEKNRRFLEPLYPFIVVRELTPEVIKEAIGAFLIEEEEDDFWFKLYNSIPLLTIDDLNLIIDRHKKEMQAEEEED